MSGENREIQQVATFLTEESRLTREPWRRDQLRRREQANRVTKRGDNEKDLMLEMAKQGLLAPHEVLSMSYILFDGDLDFYSSLLMCASGSESIKRHNWMICEASPPSFVERWGEVIESLEYPLFPCDRRFLGLNLALLTLHASTIQAGVRGRGGGTSEGISKFFRKDGAVVQLEGRGAGYLQVEQGTHPDQYVVRVDPIENAFAQLSARVSQLEHRPPPPPSAGPKGSAPRCYRCGMVGHMARTCQRPAVGAKNGAPPPQ